MYDVAVIGSGPGGYVAAIRASQLGLKTAVVERAELGGICLNWGCIPTKALLKSAQAFEYLTHAKDYGIRISGRADVDFGAVVGRSRDIADRTSKGVQFLMKKNMIDIIRGTGKIKPAKKIEVTNETGGTSLVEAKHIILAVGARPRALPNLPMDGKKVIDYRKAMALPSQPRSMVVVGSGATGSEFAYFYNAIGTNVTLVECLPTVVPAEDEAVSKQLERSFKKAGMEVMTSSEVLFVDTRGDVCKVTIKTPKGEQTVEAKIVLSAVGVQANIENLGLEETGITQERGKILTDKYYRTNVSGYYAIGDCVAGPELAHVASAEGIVCVEKIAGHHPEPVDYHNIPVCTYTSPEIASIGITEGKARETGHEIKVGKFPYSASGKARTAEATEGFVKLIFDAKCDRLLGAHLMGDNVTEIIAELVVARKLGATGPDIIKTIHPHPTLSEAVMEAAAAAYGKAINL